MNGLIDDDQENATNRGRIGKLFSSDDEVLESLEIVGGGQSFINEKADIQNFMKAGPSASLLHIVCHGYVEKNNPLSSGLVLSKTKGSDDFILKASDFYSMRLRAEMAVLSACHTGAVSYTHLTLPTILRV